ncbi:ISAs1 family transposase [Tomitella cavernea]|uniref:ISAs1 family transposase n=1 Tax=Tomitella cavernea TaxID=1387982 RepID=A0ABP9C5L0_9ACTN|nr:ISAs1 family transposase [Tomitella cavernea]
MPSSPTPPATATPTRHERLLEVLETVPDPRDNRGVRYPLAGMLALAVTATIAGTRSFTAIGQWAAAATAEHLATFGLGRTDAPDESTLRKLFARVDGDALDAALGVWMWTRTFVAGGRLVIALDGKTVRGARDRKAEGRAPHLVAAFDHGAGAVLGQVAVDAKTNEIPATRTLLAQFDLRGVTVSLDALHTQTATAEQIISAGGDYLLTVKKNIPALHAQLKALPWKDVPPTRSTVQGRGRRITRTIKATAVPDWIDFPGAAQVAQLRRTVTRKGKTSREVVYLITSADHAVAPPDVIAAWARGHWGIEALHYIRDVTYGEDLSQVRTGQSPRVMATFRNIAVSLLRLGGWNNIAEALRHHARWPDDALTPALT